jgi:hypothetical protein
VPQPQRLLALASALLAASAAFAQNHYASPVWYIDQTDAGYSDFIIQTSGAFPPGAIHEFVSGEWGAAIGYDGIESVLPPPQRTMWLEPDWSYPAWTTNSAFAVVSPGSFPFDMDGDGLPEGSAVISNGDVEITLGWDFVDTVDGTPMGRGGGSSIRSSRYVMLVTYTITNLQATTMNGVRFYQFLHGHPANDERPMVRAVYDTALYPGPLQGFRYDVTEWSTSTGDPSGEPTGCLFEDHIGFATEIAPADFGLGSYRGHEDRPETGLHVDVENDTLGNQTSFGPDEVAGATRIDLGSIAPLASASVRVLLSIRSDDLSPNATTVAACARMQDTGADPFLALDKGACGATTPDQPWDVIVGDLRALSDAFGVAPLGTVECVANDVSEDRVTLQTLLSDCRRAVFVLARKGAGLAFDYGMATGGSFRYPLAGDCP